MKERTGFIVEKDGRLYVRVCFTDSLGKKRELMRRAKDEADAEKLRKKLIKQLDAEDSDKELEAERTTFEKVASQYKDLHLIPAKYVGDRKVAGRRSLAGPLIWVARLIKEFGKAKLRSITYASVDAYRLKRLDEGLTIASVNRELELLRAILNFAKREGLIIRTPFEMGAPLISKADETRRDRVMSRDEEERILAACVDKREHLRPLVIAAVDTGMRRGELLTLKWEDVDLEAGIITIKAFNTKTARGREVQITSRLRVELEKLRSDFPAPDALVFGIADNCKKSWNTACRVTGVKGLRFHDLRHTFCSRMIEAGMPIDEVAKLAGHTQINTTYKHYLNVTRVTLDKARALLDAFNEKEKDEITNKHFEG
jgi:integrase